MLVPPGNLHGPITFQHGERLCGNPDLVAKLNTLAQKGDERIRSGTPTRLHIDYMPGLGYVFYVLPGEEADQAGTTQFAEVISYTVIVAGARWRYLVQPGDYTSEGELEQTDAAFDSCWTLGPESGRIYVTNSFEQNNTAADLPGGEGSDMLNADGVVSERKPHPVGSVVPLFWNGTIWMLAAPNHVDRGCA